MPMMRHLVILTSLLVAVAASVSILSMMTTVTIAQESSRTEWSFRAMGRRLAA